VLIVTNDNDFIVSQPNRFMVFAIDRMELPEFTPQQFSHGFSHECRSDHHDDRADKRDRD
jgi:hypothetical protein